MRPVLGPLGTDFYLKCLTNLGIQLALDVNCVVNFWTRNVSIKKEKCIVKMIFIGECRFSLFVYSFLENVIVKIDFSSIDLCIESFYTFKMYF